MLAISWLNYMASLAVPDMIAPMQRPKEFYNSQQLLVLPPNALNITWIGCFVLALSISAGEASNESAKPSAPANDSNTRAKQPGSESGGDTPKIIASWNGDYKSVKYKGREFIVGVRGDAAKEYPLVGSRAMTESAYAESVFPMTIESQDSHVIYDKTQKRFIVFNVAFLST